MGGEVSDAIRSLVNARGSATKCARVLHEVLLVSDLIYARDDGKEREVEVCD